MLTFAAGLLWGTSFRMDIPGGKGREISIERFGESFRSMVGHSKNSSDESNQWIIQENAGIDAKATPERRADSFSR
jgi:hypothetical protein